MNIQNLEMKFEIEEKAIADDAEARFFWICAFNLAEAGQRKMEAAAFRVREHLQAQMRMQAAVSFWNRPVLTGDALLLGDAVLRCGAFGRIPADAIKGAFVYLLTIGETDIEAEGNIMTELYHDIWGTVYTEAALRLLCEERLADAAKNLCPDQKGNYLWSVQRPGTWYTVYRSGRKGICRHGHRTERTW